MRELGQFGIEKGHELGHFRPEIAAGVVRRHHRPSLARDSGDRTRGRKCQNRENYWQPTFT